MKSQNQNNYVVFEAIKTDVVFNDRVRIYHTFDFHQNETISVGRRNGVHAKIADITISRLHWILRLVNHSEIWIEDWNSKFGTLTMLRKPVSITRESPHVGLQVSKVYFHLSFKESGGWWRLLTGPYGLKQGVTFNKFEEDFPEEIRKVVKRRKFKL